MTRKYFGTDGVRGRVGSAPITPDFVMRLGHAAGRALMSSVAMPAGERPRRSESQCQGVGPAVPRQGARICLIETPPK